MKYFLITISLLAANWLQQGVASGEGGGRKEIDEHNDKENEKGEKSHHQIDESLFSSLRGAYLETQSLQNPVDNVSEFGVEKGVAFTSGYFSNGDKELKKSSSAVSTILKPPTDYVLTFEIVPKGTVSGSSIIHFTTGGDCCNYGERVPGIWFHGSSTRLHVSTGTSSNGNDYQDLSEELPLNKKSLIEVRVVGSLATVAVDGVIKSSKKIGSRAALDKVNVYHSDPWHPSANAIISDISFTSASADVFESVYYSYLPRKITKSKESNPVATILKPPTDYVLTFGIVPKGTVSGWNSIIHFTTGGNCCNYGQRVPGIWFDGSSTRLHVFTQVGYNFVHQQGLSEELPLNKKSLIEVRVVGSTATVAVDGVIKSSKKTGSRAALDKVNVYIGDPWHPSANAIISDVIFSEA